MNKWPQLENKQWLREQVKTKPVRHIAAEIGAPYTRTYLAIKKFGIEVPKRTKYVYTEESRKEKSDHIKAALEVRFPGGRYGDEASNWKGGISRNYKKCIDCSGPIAKHGATRCRKCEGENRTGNKNINWRGGITLKNALIRNSRQMKLWRKTVYERDNYTCQECGREGGPLKELTLHAHHIHSFAKYPELRFAIDNGITLCEDCHKNTDTYAGKSQALQKLHKQISYLQDLLNDNDIKY